MTNESRLPPGHADWDALARYLAGESPPGEAAAIRRWLAEHPAEATALTAADAALARLRDTPPAIDLDAAWRNMTARLDDGPGETGAAAIPGASGMGLPSDSRAVGERAFPARSRGALSPASRSTPGFRDPARSHTFAPGRIPLLRAAAALLLVGAGVTLWWAAARDEPAITAAAAPRSFTTGPGQRDSLVLVDGTRILLGPGSSIRTDVGYGTVQRDVHLEGEALFDVPQHDARPPFVVHVSGAVIQDLGTTFTVRVTNGTIPTTTVAVTSGAVQVARAGGGADSGVVVREGSVATVRAAGPVAIAGADAGAVTAALGFTRGQIVFRDTPLTEVAATLRRWYGVEVRLGDPALHGRTLTATYEGESLSEVVDAIALVFGAAVHRADSVVTIGRSPGGDPRR